MHHNLLGFVALPWNSSLSCVGHTLIAFAPPCPIFASSNCCGFNLSSRSRRISHLLIYKNTNNSSIKMIFPQNCSGIGIIMIWSCHFINQTYFPLSRYCNWSLSLRAVLFLKNSSINIKLIFRSLLLTFI